MRVLLIKDVYKLGRAGDVKRVADGYGRNYLIPQGLAVKATPGALKQADRIKESAQRERARLNQEMGALAEQLEGVKLAFSVRAGETGKLYGSITTMMIADSIESETGFRIDRRDVDSEPIKTLGVHQVPIRLTMDLVPEVTVLIHREGEPPESAYAVAELEEEAVEAFAELQAELEAEAALEEEADEAEESADDDDPYEAEADEPEESADDDDPYEGEADEPEESADEDAYEAEETAADEFPDEED